MEEKIEKIKRIKLIISIIGFIVVLIFANIIFENIEKNKGNNVVDENIVETEKVIDDSITEENNIEENNIEEGVTSSVIASYDEENGGGFILTEPEKTGEVFEVTEENFEKEVLKSTKKVLVEFYTDWCDACKTLEPVLEEIAKENLDLKVVKIHAERNINIAATYGTNYIPMLLVMEDGKEVDQAYGAISKEDILELVK